MEILTIFHGRQAILCPTDNQCREANLIHLRHTIENIAGSEVTIEEVRAERFLLIHQYLRNSADMSWGNTQFLQLNASLLLCGACRLKQVWMHPQACARPN